MEVWPVTQDVVYPGGSSMCTEKKLYSCAFEWNVLKISMRSISSNVSFKTCVSLLIFCFDDLSIGVSGVLKSPTITVLLTISPFISAIVCLMYWGALMLDAYNCYVFLLGWSLDHYVMFFLISCNLLYFKVYFCLIWGLVFQLSFASHLHGIYFSILSLSVYMCL